MKTKGMVAFYFTKGNGKHSPEKQWIGNGNCLAMFLKKSTKQNAHLEFHRTMCAYVHFI